jgi:hypothetical protein
MEATTTADRSIWAANGNIDGRRRQTVALAGMLALSGEHP